jgi:glycosyltransferase involved in cell wall biosynthesis
VPEPLTETFPSGMQIIVHKKSGFHIDPYHGQAAAELMADFFENASKDDGASWEKMSEASLQRIKEKYTWELYADRLMTLTRVYRYTPKVPPARLGGFILAQMAPLGIE